MGSVGCAAKPPGRLEGTSLRCRNCGTLHLEPATKCNVCRTRFVHTKLLGHKGIEDKMREKVNQMPEETIQQYQEAAMRQGTQVRTPRGYRNFTWRDHKDGDISIKRR